MNYVSYEYGLKIEGVTYDEIAEVYGVDPKNFYATVVFFEDEYDLSVESNSPDSSSSFISFGKFDNEDLTEALEKGIPPEPEYSAPIRAWFKEKLPKARLKWGVIKTER